MISTVNPPGAYTLVRLADVYYCMGNIDEADRCLRQGLAIVRRINDPHNELSLVDLET